MASFAFVQFEFGHLLGPPDGRYLVRPAPDAEPTRVVVLATLGAPERRRSLGRKPKPTDVTTAEPEPVPTARATLVQPDSFESAADASEWLDRLRGDEDELHATVDEAAAALNLVLRSYRAAALDGYVRDVSSGGALVVRAGHGAGEKVAEGRYAEAIELPRGKRPKKRHEMLAPQERLAAVLTGREELLACEELFLRARSDVEAGRPREAALQARIAVEALMAELGDKASALGEHRAPVSAAANAALQGGELDPEHTAAVEAAVIAMERVLRRRALGA